MRVSHRRSFRIKLLVIATAAAAQTAGAANSVDYLDYLVEKVALSGEVAPGGATFTSSDLGVSINSSEDVAFASQLSGEELASGIFVRRAGVLSSVALSGEAAAPGGTWFLFGGFPVVNDLGGVSYFAVARDVSAIWGVFLDSGPGADATLLLDEDPAPQPPGGSFHRSGDWDMHSYDAGSSAHSFLSSLIGGSTPSGYFEQIGAVAIPLVLSGEGAPGGGTLDDIVYAHRSGAGEAAYVATLTGTSAMKGLYRREATGATTRLAHEGDVAPGSGGATYFDLVLPRVNDAGQTVFLASFDEMGNEGAVFVYDGAVVSRIIGSGDAFPGPGGGDVFQIPSMIPINGRGDLALPISSSGGSVAAGVFLYRSETDTFEPLVLAGEVAPDAGGATFASFGFLDLNDQGAVAFHATLSDARTGIFVVSPAGGTAVPATGLIGLIVTGVALLVIGKLELQGRATAS